MPERVPWTIYSNLLPQGEAERKFRSQGLALIYPFQTHSVQSFETPDVEVAQKTVLHEGRSALRIHYRTPVGELTEVRRSDYASGMAGYVADWRLEFMIKKPGDYEVLEFIIRNQVFRLGDEAVLQAQEEIGDDGVVIFRVNRVPFQRLWIEYTGLERLCLDLNDYPELVERVMEAMIEKDVEMWQRVAASPFELVQCPDNITADITGPALFERFFIPFYEELYQVMHAADKPLFVHIDGSAANLADAVGKLPEDMIVEALTPPPTGDLSMAQARAAWKDRPIWINFPSSVFLSSATEIEAAMEEILRQAAPGDGFLLGITENMPGTRWREGLSIIGQVLDRHGKCPITI
jgi:hypothetical protein